MTFISSDQNNPCSVCHKTDGQCSEWIIPALLCGPLETQDHKSIRCVYRDEFLYNHPDVKMIMELSEKFFKEDPAKCVSTRVYKYLNQDVKP